MKGNYKRRQFWCICDKAIVGLGEKCKLCGRKEFKGKTRKKEPVYKLITKYENE